MPEGDGFFPAQVYMGHKGKWLIFNQTTFISLQWKSNSPLIIPLGVFCVLYWRDGPKPMLNTKRNQTGGPNPLRTHRNGWYFSDGSLTRFGGLIVYWMCVLCVLSSDPPTKSPNLSIVVPNPCVGSSVGCSKAESSKGSHLSFAGAGKKIGGGGD